VRLGHDVHGDDDAPVLVLGSSLGTTRTTWEPQLALLAQRFRVIRYEHRGHGASESVTGPSRIDDLGADVLALLDELGVGRFSYAGISLGGMVGIWLAAEQPQRLQRLAVCCTSAFPDAPVAWRERASTVRRDGLAAISGPVISRWFTPGWAAAHPDVVRRFTDEFTDEVDAEGYASCSDAIAVLDLRDRLGAVTAPTLVVAGGQDEALPLPHSETIAGGIAGSRLEVVPEAAHLATVERADLCTPLLLEHLGGTR
jgi:3-oxoadipate enol-lactonase